MAQSELARGKEDPATLALSITSAAEFLCKFDAYLLLKKAIAGAVHTCPSLSKKHISPHVIRHATATHLLQAGVDISVIALWLGHESIDTTHIYMDV